MTSTASSGSSREIKRDNLPAAVKMKQRLPDLEAEMLIIHLLDMRFTHQEYKSDRRYAKVS
jgi:hypothetical protein